MSAPRTPSEVIARLEARFGEAVPLTPMGDGRSARVIADREHLLPVLEFLKTDSDLAFDVLTDLTAVDRLDLASPELGGARFLLVYQLDSSVHRHRFRVALRIPGDDLVAPSATVLWPAALWAEREVFDLFGIEFDDHPDLRRVLLSEAYPGYPLRKDEPPEGTTRRDAFLETLGSRSTGPRITSTSPGAGGAGTETQAEPA